MLATRDAFGAQLLKSSQKNDNIVVLSADLSKPTRTDKFAKEFPNRFFEIGIAESNMIGIGSGLSEYGFKVVMTSFATFLTGKYDPVNFFTGSNYKNSEDLRTRVGKNYENLLSVCLLDDAGHWVQQEKPKEVNKFILDFLSGL